MATHRELITAGKFDEKFKRALLDYYSYGFKNLGSFEAKKRQTISEDWLRLNRVIADYLEWSANNNEIMFASVDSQSMEENPFHRVYRFCKYKPMTYPAYFLHTMAALSEDVKLRGGIYSLDLDDDQLIHLEDAIVSQRKLKTSDLIYFYSDKFAAADGDDKNKTPNNRLDDLAKMGLVNCEQSKGEKGGKGDRHWSLPELTIKKIIDAGNYINKDFEHHFHSALDFFSKYYILGEVGTFLLDRMGDEYVSPFRFKHEYFMQSLNDFNIIDLLYAIENGKWCRIKYSHGTLGIETDLLCYPLEIRISNMQGREFLMYYEPFHRSYTALRIEFIDSIEFYDDKKVKSILAQTGYHPMTETVDADISNARESMKYSWGVSTTKKQEGNAINVVEPHSVSMQIAYTPETDYYIVNRLNRERRFGVVTVADENQYLRFTVDVSDDVELRPWMRSFYSRIMTCEGMDTNNFFLDTDVENVVGLLIRDELVAPQTKAQATLFSRWEIPFTAKSALGNGTKAREHDLLFNEIFSIYYYIIADVFTQLSYGSENVSYTESEVDNIIINSLNKYYLKIGQETEEILPSEIKELLLYGGFLAETARIMEGKFETVKNETGSGYSRKPKTEKAYRFKYKCEQNIDLYRDVVPLSTIEQRWLLTVINDSKFQLFFSDEEINELRKLLKEFGQKVFPLPMDKVVFFDRFHFSEKNTEREATVLATLLEGIYDQRTVRIKYHTMKKQVKIGIFKPIILEFSKRNNRFQGFFQECGSEKIYTMNVSRIESVVETNNTFDYEKALQDLVSFREEDMTSFEVEFYNVRNMVDRILTEFSPWKKQCSHDAETGLYRLKIFYQKQDEIDLVIRLLSYGANLRFIDKEHSIYKEILSRMNRQMELIREGRRNKDEREGGENR